MKLNWQTIIPACLVLGIFGALSFYGRPTEAFLAGAIGILGAAQAQRAVRKNYARKGDPPDTKPEGVEK